MGAASIAVSALSACGTSGAGARGDGPELPEDPYLGTRFAAPRGFVAPPVDLAVGEPLDLAFERVMATFRGAGHEPFDARLAYATSAASGFARYFTVNDAEDPAGRTQHTIFVVTEAWTEERVRAFLLSYVVMPAAPESATGRPWFHLYSAAEPPWAVRFLFSNTPQAAFEAAVLSELGAGAWHPSEATALAGRLRALLERAALPVASEVGPACPEALDTLFLGLPHPPEGEPAGVFGADYVPEASLAAIGLLMGESLRTALAGAAEWEVDGAHALYPRLRVTGVAEGIMRPIPVTIELFSARTDVTPRQYCDRMRANLSARGEEGGSR